MVERFNLQNRIKPLRCGRRLHKELGFTLNPSFGRRLNNILEEVTIEISTQTLDISKAETVDHQILTVNASTRDIGTFCGWDDFVNALSISDIGELIQRLQMRENELNHKTKNKVSNSANNLEILVKKTHQEMIINGLIKMD
jgi:hypothetical protein